MDSELQNKLMAMVDGMPPFPKSIHRVIELTNDLNCAPKDLVQVIEHDPVITMKLLKLVNSAYYALNKSVSSVRHAVVYLGLNTVKNLALSIATVTALPRKNCRGFNINHFLLHSMTTASISQRLAKEYLKRTDSTDLFVAGLLHDFGKVVFVQSMPEEFSRAIAMASDENINLHDAEMEAIGANHTEVGAMLSEKWQLPSNLATGIRNHHTPDVFGAVDDCVFAADQISKKLQFGFSGNPIVEEFPEHVVQRFGMDLDRLIESLGDMSDEVDKAESFTLM